MSYVRQGSPGLSVHYEKRSGEVPMDSATTAPAPDTSVEEPLEPPQPTASEGVHPLAVSPEEGLLLVPQETALKALQKMLTFKYAGVLMYMNYGDRIRAHFRDSIYAHLQEHLADERKDAYALAMKITAWGGEPAPKVGKVPDVSDLHQIFITIMQTEKQLIATGRDILKMAGENVGLKVLIENMVMLDQHHLDDARRMLLCEETR